MIRSRKRCPSRRLGFSLLLSVVLVGSASAADNSTSWQMLPDSSSLGFVTSYDGAPIDGRFDVFSVALAFDPTAMTIELVVEVDVTTVDTDSTDRDEALAGSEWFAFKQHPKAVYTSTQVSLEDDGRFCTEGTLQLKGISQELPVKFRWQTDGDQATLSGTARMIGDTQINRLDFQIGSGDWEDPVIGHEVEVTFDLKLQREPSI